MLLNSTASHGPWPWRPCSVSASTQRGHLGTIPGSVVHVMNNPMHVAASSAYAPQVRGLEGFKNAMNAASEMKMISGNVIHAEHAQHGPAQPISHLRKPERT